MKIHSYPGSSRTTIAVMMTVFNRLNQTVSCIDDILNQQGIGDLFDVKIYVVDDGSTDGSDHELSRRYGEQVCLVKGPGNLYWSRGMALAQTHAAAGSPDFLLWVNNDIRIFPDSFERLIATSVAEDECRIAVGAMLSNSDRTVSYTGFVRSRRRASRLESVTPKDRSIAIDTFNGNLVLVPRSAYLRLGPIDSKYSHGYGDLDYGFRAGGAGIESWLAPGFHGHCERNSVVGTWEDANLDRRIRLRLLVSRKGLPPQSHFRYLRRVHPLIWPVVGSLSYSKRVIQIMRGH